MPVIYVKEQGAYIRKRSKRLIVEKESEILLEIPLLKVEGLVLFGNIQITTQLMMLLFNKGIDITYMTRNGRFVGSARANVSKNIFLKLAQFEKYKDESFKLEFMKEIVKSKIHNQMGVIRKSLWGSEDIEWKNRIENIKNMMKNLDSKNDRASIMGIEGAVSAEYFRVFKNILKYKMDFEKRTRRPSKDPVNALLNLGYTFLTNEMASLLEANAFETCLGFLHGVKYGRKSLALDMIEQFRQPIVDRFVIKVLNKGMFKSSDFDKSVKGVVLNEKMFDKFCIEYKNYMNNLSLGNSGTYNELMKEKVYSLRKSIMNNKPYNGYRMVL